MALSLILSLFLCQADAPKPEAPHQTGTKNLLDVWFEDGIRFKTRENDAFEGRLGGRFVGHYRAVFDRPEENQAAAFPIRNYPNGFFVRQARLELEGTLHKQWGFKVQYDLSTGFPNQSTGAAASPSNGTVRDAFMEWKPRKEFHLRFGQFMIPISQEDYTSLIWNELAERSVVSRLNPNRDIGLHGYGTLFDGVLDWFAGVNNGQSTLSDAGRSVSDTNDQKEGVLNLRVRPFLHGGSDFFRNLRFSLAGSYGLLDDIPNTPFDLITTELSVLYLDSNASPASLLDGSRRRLVPQLSWPIGPFGLRAEYLYRTDDLINGSAVEALRSRGWYTTVSYILTGEHKVPEARIIPKGDWGAVEVAFRAAQVRMTNAFESGIYLPGGNAEGVTAFSFALNWWVARNVRITWELVREKYSDPVQFDTRDEGMLMGTIVRFQIDF